MQDDGLSDLRSSLRRSTALRVAEGPAGPRVIEAFPQASVGYYGQPRPGLTFWQWCARVIPIVAAIVSTSLLAYFLLIEHRSPPGGRQQGEKSELSTAVEANDKTENGSAAQQPSTQQAQSQNPSAQAQQLQPQASPVEQQQPQPAAPTDLGPRLPMPTDDLFLMLIYSAVIALNQGNSTDNYSVLRQMGAPAFQNANSAARLAELFAPLRSRSLDLSPILLFQPKLLRKPEMNPQGLIRVTGFFPTKPERVKFDLIFQPVQGRWRLFGIAVDTMPAAPDPEPAAPAVSSAPEGAKPKPAAEPQAAKPAAPPRKPKPKSEGESGTSETSSSNVDVRDRIDTQPQPPVGEQPTQKSIWNPFAR